MSPAPNQPLKELPLLEIEDLEFIYNPNFSGGAKRYNDEGDRYFNAKIPDKETAEALQRDGWNIKWTKPSKTATPEAIAEHVPEPFLKVNVGFKFRPPTIMMIRNGTPVVITERTVGVLDSTEFSKIDCAIRARHYQMDSGQEGYKAWLAEFYGHVELSNMGQKYAYLLDSPAPSSENPTEEN